MLKSSVAFVVLVWIAASFTPCARANSLFIASQQGVREVGLDGKVARVLSHEPARLPRLMPDQKSLLYLVPNTGKLRRMDLQTGTTTAVATLPQRYRLCSKPTTDGQSSYSLKDLDVQSADDFVIDKTGQAACLTLIDRNANMANVIVNLRVSLQGTGKVSAFVDYPEGCPGPKPVPCEPVERPNQSPPAGTYDIVDGSLGAAKGPRIRLGQGDFSVEHNGVSPGGTWAVIGGNISEGDYIHRSLFLLHRQTGKIHTIQEKSRVLRHAELRTMTDNAAGAVGETEIKWLTDGALLIDSTLVWPGVGLIHLNGNVTSSP